MISLQRHLALVGMMGCGKSTVGNILAREIEVRCLDLDSLIVEERQSSISDIFAREGEDRFRHYEEVMLRRVLAIRSPVILALGGGTLLAEQNQELVRSSADSFWLQASPATLLRRLRGDQSRPVLGSQYCREDLELALALREPGYRAVAPTLQVTDGLSCETVVERILTVLRERSCGSRGDGSI